MNPKLFLSQLSQDEILKLSTDEIQQRILAEQEFINTQPHKNFLAATHGSKTKNGGLVKASINQRVKAEGHLIAAVGDEAVWKMVMKLSKAYNQVLYSVYMRIEQFLKTF